MKQLTGGTVSRAAASSTVPVVGVFNGVQYTDPTSKEVVFKNHYPGSIVASDIIAFIIDDPNVVFEIQADDTFPVADLFGNFDVVDQSTTGDTASGRSNMELDVTTGATTTTLPLKAIDISQDPENSPWVRKAKTITLARLITNVTCCKIRLHAGFHRSTLEHLQPLASFSHRSENEVSIWVIKVVVDRITLRKNTSVLNRVEVVICGARS